MIIPFANMGGHPEPIDLFGNDEYTTVLWTGDTSTSSSDYGGETANVVYLNGGSSSDVGGYYGTGVSTTGSTGMYMLNGSDDWDFGSGDFTIEICVKLPVLTDDIDILSPDRALVSTPGFLINISEVGLIRFLSNNGSEWIMMSEFPTTATSNTWYNISISREGNVFRGFLDGVKEFETTKTHTLNPNVASRLAIGGQSGTKHSQAGIQISALRLSKGIARYTADYTIRSNFFGEEEQYGNDQFTTVLVHGESNATDHSYAYSDSPHTVTGSYYTDGVANGAMSPDDGCLSFASYTSTSEGMAISNTNTDGWTFGTGDFTVETWVKVNDLTVNRHVLTVLDRTSVAGAGKYSAPFLLYVAAGTGLYWFGSYGGTTWDIVKQYTNTVVADTWYHVAFTRSGTTFRTFFNGVMSATWESSSAMYTPTMGVTLGGKNVTSADERFDGEIDETRISKGICRYSRDFTPRTIAFGSN